MDEDNMPMAFRNGYVYSREVSASVSFQILVSVMVLKALEEMAAKNAGIVTCPRSGETCEFNKLRKAFIP